MRQGGGSNCRNGRPGAVMKCGGKGGRVGKERTESGTPDGPKWTA